MVKLVVLYGLPEDPAAFGAYFAGDVANFATGGATLMIAEL